MEEIKGAEALVVGSVSKNAEGRFDVRYKLYDLVKASMLSGFQMDAQANKLRLTGHKIADDVYEKLLGLPRCFLNTYRLCHQSRQ